MGTSWRIGVIGSTRIRNRSSVPLSILPSPLRLVKKVSGAFLTDSSVAAFPRREATTRRAPNPDLKRSFRTAGDGSRRNTHLR
jgi:hypothetical protein